MTRGATVPAQCALSVALRRRHASRPAPPVRVHRGARLVRSAADTASFSFGFREDEAAAPVTDPTIGELARAVEAGNVDAALALVLATPLPASRKAAATDSCTRLVAELCRRGRPRDAERAFHAAVSHGACVARRRAATRAEPPTGLSLSDAVSTSLLRALVEAQEAEGAVAVFRVRHREAPPPVQAYTELIACVPLLRRLLRLARS
jgi:hypothetical protein